MKVVVVCNADWVLWHIGRAALVALREEGYEGTVVSTVDRHANKIRDLGFEVIPWKLRRRSLNPVWEAQAALQLWAVYRELRPDLALHFTIKAIVYGSLAARFTKMAAVVNVWTGLGWTFADSRKAQVVRAALLPALRAFTRGYWTLSENAADLERLRRFGLAHRERSQLVLGSGVDTQVFKPGIVPPHDPPVVLMAARLLWEKGVKEFVEAARMLKANGCEPNSGSPGSGTRATLPLFRRTS